MTEAERTILVEAFVALALFVGAAVLIGAML